ncbi:class I SAM-dependent methyltransferase [Nonomuraea sp. NEAU-A123]|uniref:class I SAM-dependent methyltransferase n=1 Tax=Nonomuraea sp. NEAU-A123 TaxID=2839649 RepID=UPI001BE4DD6B|nr:class I SAM-dependent methyltransferase [Nonomuraea sp. NEAU-A123]MBT2233658.1 methyltransferase domain-containing protein [Nonomuraea sp. NEAU-A123]
MAGDTICRIGSMTKPIVAACAMTLIEDCPLAGSHGCAGLYRAARAGSSGCSDITNVKAAAQTLAERVEEQWRTESRHRLVHDPRPMPVRRRRTAHEALMSPPHLITTSPRSTGHAEKLSAVSTPLKFLITELGCQRMNTDNWLEDTRSSYDTVAFSYADQMREALGEYPYLRAALSLFAELVRTGGGGLVADVGCGPGHVTAHLQELGLDAFGIDLSPVMIDVARRDHPHLRFEVGSMTDLDLPDASVAALIAFWSLIHVPDDAVPTAFGHFKRVLRPGGTLLLGFHVGDESRLKTRGYGGHPMKVHVNRRQPTQVAGWLGDAGFTVEAQMLLNLDESAPEAVLFARVQAKT